MDISLVLRKAGGEEQLYFQYDPVLTSKTLMVPAGINGFNLRVNVIFPISKYQEIRIRSIIFQTGSCKGENIYYKLFIILHSVYVRHLQVHIYLIGQK